MTILLWAHITIPALCQNTYYTYAAPYLLSANAGGNFTNSLNASFNPSLIPFIKNLEVAAYAEKKYLTDINIILLSVCAPFNNNGISLTFQRYGNILFNENTFGLSYGKSIGTVNLGVLFQHIRLKIQDAGSVSLIKAGIACSMKVAENVFVSWRIINPDLFSKAGVSKVHSASLFSLSFGYEASPEVYAAFESLKEKDRPLALIFSLHYRLAEKFVFALNWNTYTNQPYTAVSWKQKLVTIEAGCSYHSTLGGSPTLSFLFQKPGGK
jgi:hypothetical protein